MVLKFQILSNNAENKGSMMQPFPLEELYFHDKDQEFSM
jgi:hypothetical protein